MKSHLSYILAAGVLTCMNVMYDTADGHVYVNMANYGAGHETPEITGDDDAYHKVEIMQKSNISDEANGVVVNITNIKMDVIDMHGSYKSTVTGTSLNVTEIKMDVFNMVKEAIQNKEIDLTESRGQTKQLETSTYFNATEIKIEILTMLKESHQLDDANFTEYKQSEDELATTNDKNSLNITEFKTEIAAMISMSAEESTKKIDKCTKEIEAIKESIGNMQVAVVKPPGDMESSRPAGNTDFNMTEFKSMIFNMLTESINSGELLIGNLQENAPEATFPNEFNVTEFKNEILAMVRESVRTVDRTSTGTQTQYKTENSNDLNVTQLKTEIIDEVRELLQTENMKEEDSEREESVFNVEEFKMEIFSLLEESNETGSHDVTQLSGNISFITSKLDAFEEDNKYLRVQFQRMLRWQRKMGNINERDIKMSIFEGLRTTSCKQLHQHHDLTEPGKFLMHSSRAQQPIYKHCNFQIFEGVTTCAELQDQYNVTQPGGYILKRNSSTSPFELYCDFTIREGVDSCAQLISRYGVTEPGYYIVNSASHVEESGPNLDNSTVAATKEFLYCDFALHADLRSCHELKVGRGVEISGYYLLMSELTGQLTFTYCHFEIFEGVSECRELLSLHNMTKSGYYYMKPRGNSDVFTTYCSQEEILTCEDVSKELNKTEAGFYMVKPDIWLQPTYKYCQLEKIEVNSCEEIAKRELNPKTGYHLMKRSDRGEIPTVTYCHFETLEGVSTCDDIASKHNITQAGYYYYFKQDGANDTLSTFCRFPEKPKPCLETQKLSGVRGLKFYITDAKDSDGQDAYCDLVERKGVRTCEDLSRYFSIRQNGYYFFRRNPESVYEHSYCDFTYRPLIFNCQDIKDALPNPISGYYLIKTAAFGTTRRLHCEMKIFHGISSCDDLVNYTQPVYSLSAYFFKPNSTTEIVYKECDFAAEGDIRLIGGSAEAGRVEIYHNGEWGTVCDDSWDLNDAFVVCRFLGFSNATEAPGGATYGQGKGITWLDDVNCIGDEKNLGMCDHNGWGVENCGHGEDASVVCGL